MPSIFSRIIAGEIPSYKIAEDDRFYAFLDISPRRPGHTLVIPKKEVDYLFDIDPAELGDLFIFARRVAKAIKKAIPSKRVGVAVLGLEVPHAHVHLIPLQKETDMNLQQPKCDLSPDQMADICRSIVQQFE